MNFSNLSHLPSLFSGSFWGSSLRKTVVVIVDTNSGLDEKTVSVAATSYFVVEAITKGDEVVEVVLCVCNFAQPFLFQKTPIRQNLFKPLSASGKLY
jgi:hypothetical protein